MSILKYIGIAVLTLTMTTAWAGGQPATAQGKPYISASQSMNVTAVVEAIDHETREVTLGVSGGDSVTFTAREDVHNLAQVKVGDLVNADYIYNLTIEVYDNPGRVPGEHELSAMRRAREGDKPGLAAYQVHVVTATVEAINIEASTFKLKWPNETVEEFVADDPEKLKGAKVGDFVVITQTAKLAISVQEVLAQQPGKL